MCTVEIQNSNSIMLPKRKREYLYDTDVAIPARTKSRYASKKLITRQCTTENQVQEQSTSTSTTDAYEQASSLPPRLPTSTFEVCDPGNSGNFVPATATVERDKIGGTSYFCTQQLYSTSEISAFEYHANVLEYSLKHCLTKCAFEDLLKLIASLLPKPNLASPSIYKQNKFFSNFYDKPSTEKHQYCTSCHHLLDLGEAECPNKCVGKIECFLLCDIEQQLKNTLTGQ